MVGMRKANHIPIIAILSLMFMLLGIPFIVTAQFEPNITLDAQSPVEVRVAPGRINFTHARGNVTCESTMSSPIVVNYYASCTVGRATVNPPMGVFNGGDTETSNITITIHLPRRTSSSVHPVAMINGTWEQWDLSGEIEPISVDVNVVPYSNVQTNCEESGRNNNPGEETVFDVQIENRGNRDDLYLINITNREELEEEGITFDHFNEITIEEGNTSEIALGVRTPSDILGNWQRFSSGRPYTVHLRVSSNVSDEPVWDEFVLVLWVEMDAPTFLAIVFSCPATIITLVLIVILIVVYYRKKTEVHRKGKKPEDESPQE